MKFRREIYSTVVLDRIRITRLSRPYLTYPDTLADTIHSFGNSSSLSTIIVVLIIIQVEIGEYGLNDCCKYVLTYLPNLSPTSSFSTTHTIPYPYLSSSLFKYLPGRWSRRPHPGPVLKSKEHSFYHYRESFFPTAFQLPYNTSSISLPASTP